jgi:hypothetical protein
MADRAIKPDAGNDLVFEDAGSTDRMRITDGGSTILYEDGGSSALVINADGSINKALQPCFLASADDQAIDDNSCTTVSFATELFDQGGDFNTTTKTFTAPIAGKYLLSFSLSLDNAQSSYYYMKIITSHSDGSYVGAFRNDSGSADRAGRNLTIVAEMDASDTAYCQICGSGGTASHDVISWSKFSGCLLA